MNGTLHKRSTSNNYTSPSSLLVKSIKTPVTSATNSLLNKLNASKKPSLTPTRENKNFSMSGGITQRPTTASQSKSKSTGRSNSSSFNPVTQNKINVMKPLIPVVNKNVNIRTSTGSSFNKSPFTSNNSSTASKMNEILNMTKKSPNLSYLNSTRTKSPPNNGSKNSTPKSLLEKFNRSPLLKNKIVKPSIDLHQSNYSIEKSSGSYSPNSVDGKIKVTRSTSGKSPTNTKSNIVTKISPVNRIKPTHSISSKNPASLSQTKNSLLKQYEDLKNRSVSPLIPSYNSNNISLRKPGSISNPSSLHNSSKLDQRTTSKFGARGTIQVSQPEYFLKMMQSEKINDKEKDNKFTTGKDFRENNTSPLVVRVIFFNHFKKNSFLIEKSK
jgi:hypothetical protein